MMRKLESTIRVKPTSLFSGKLTIDTHNFAEAWHRTSKNNYLGSVRNQCADHFVFIVLDDILPHYKLKVT